jgi:hypothetical protein
MAILSGCGDFAFRVERAGAVDDDAAGDFTAILD